MTKLTPVPATANAPIASSTGITRRTSCTRPVSTAKRLRSGGADYAHERDHLAGVPAEVVRQREGTLTVRRHPSLLRGLAAQLQPCLVKHAQPGRTDRMPERLQTTVRVHRKVPREVERTREHFLPRRPARAEPEVLHQDQLGRREAVVHLCQG